MLSKKGNWEQFKPIIILWLLIIFLYSCQTPPRDFHLIETESVETQNRVTVQVNNCEGWLSKLQTYHYPFAGKSVGVENLKANGGEPFRSIRKQIWHMYGEPTEELQLSVPAYTHQEFTLLVANMTYRGIVSGEIIDENKIVAQQEAIYFYPFVESITVESKRGIPCP